VGTCVSEHELRRLHTHELDPPDEQRVREHLGRCRDCAQRDTAIVSHHESWVAEFQSAGVPDDCIPPHPTHATAALDPKAIPGYTISGELSAGGQGVVYRATQESTRRAVAIKVLREGRFASRGARRRFEREIELVANLRHASIISVFDSGHTADGRQFCVMDFVEGTPLTQFVSDNQMGLRPMLDLFATICGAVSYAHQRGVIHRDLKPSNILVDADGCPYVLDFGLAKSLGDAAHTALTVDGIVGGTVPYMSPEHARADGDGLDVRSDVYTLGVILYELVTNRFPYPVDGAVFEVLKHIAETPPTAFSRAVSAPKPNHADTGSPRLAPRATDNELETIVLKALSKEPDRRYQSAGELERDIRHYLAGRPIDAKRDSHWYVLRKSLHRYRAAAAVALAFVVMVTGSAIALGVMYTRQVAARERAEHQAQIARQAKSAEEVQRQRAQRRFDELRSLARTFIFDFHDLIDTLPGATPAKQLLVQTGLEYLNSLAEDLDPDDRQLQAELGAAYVELGDLLGDPRSPNLGDPDAALVNYEKGLELIRAVVRADPANERTEGGLGLTLNRIGQLLRARGRPDEAKKHFSEALQIFERRHAARPQDAGVADALTWNYSVLAAEHTRAGRSEEALAVNDKALQISAAIAEANPENGHLQHNLAAAHSHTAELLLAMGRSEDGLRAHRQSLGVLDRLVERDTNNVLYQHSLATACERVGATLQQLARQEEALPLLRRSLSLCEAIVASDPGFDKAETSATRARSRIGEAHLALGRPRDALASFQSAYLGARDAAAAAPDSASVQRDFAVACYKLAEAHRALGQDVELAAEARIDHWNQAHDWFQRSLDLFVNMREKGLLAAGDTGVPVEITREIERCVAREEDLRQSAVEP
jgi:non-specific serine/threonine protein kinase/serine/threonine-protein kinase